MFKCHVCYSEEFQIDYVNEVFQIDGKFYLVEKFLLRFVLVVVKKFLAEKQPSELELCYMKKQNLLNQFLWMSLLIHQKSIKPESGN